MIIFGKQVVLHYAARHAEQIEEIFVAKKLQKEDFKQLAATKKKISQIDNKTAQSLSHGGNHQGFLARIIPPQPADLRELIRSANRLVIAHEISDVGNLGAIARSAYAMGFSGLIISGCGFALSGALRASAGALAELPHAGCEDILSLVNELKMQDFKVFAAALSEAALPHTHAFCGYEKIALILGSEGQGLSARVIKSAHAAVKIAMHADFDSLNVSSAFAILADRISNGTT